MGDILYSIKSKIRYSDFGNNIVENLLDSRMGDILYKAFDKFNLTDASRDMINPSAAIMNEMKNSELFFQKNTERIDIICDSLDDELSREIYKKLIHYRQTLNKKDRPPFSMHDQYFVKDIIKLDNHEVFIDCGAYIGDTINNFIKRCNGNYKRIIAFEPDIINIEKIKNHNTPNCILINAGVWNYSTKLQFEVKGHSGIAKIAETITQIAEIDNKASQSYTEEIYVHSIDETESCHDCTFIKMDIEGSEMNALIGAKETITKMRPKLAICIYHSDEDMLRIPEWIINLNLGYKLYIRHHSGSKLDTVLYALPS